MPLSRHDAMSIMMCSSGTFTVRAGDWAEAQQKPPVSMAAASFDPAVLPYRQWRVFWVQHEASHPHALVMALAPAPCAFLSQKTALPERGAKVWSLGPYLRMQT